LSWKATAELARAKRDKSDLIFAERVVRGRRARAVACAKTELACVAHEGSINHDCRPCPACDHDQKRSDAVLNVDVSKDPKQERRSGPATAVLCSRQVELLPDDSGPVVRHLEASLCSPSTTSAKPTMTTYDLADLTLVVATPAQTRQTGVNTFGTLRTSSLSSSPISLSLTTATSCLSSRLLGQASRG
jgi:hypothetical protein